MQKQLICRKLRSTTAGKLVSFICHNIDLKNSRGVKFRHVDQFNHSPTEKLCCAAVEQGQYYYTVEGGSRWEPLDIEDP